MKRFYLTPMTQRFLQAFIGMEAKGVSVRMLRKYHVSEKTRARV